MHFAVVCWTKFAFVAMVAVSAVPFLILRKLGSLRIVSNARILSARFTIHVCVVFGILAISVLSAICEMYMMHEISAALAMFAILASCPAGPRFWPASSGSFRNSACYVKVEYTHYGCDRHVMHV